MLPPHELKKKKFSHSLRGYSVAEVDEHNEFVLEKYTELYRKFDAMEKELECAKAALAEYRAKEDVIQAAIVNAKQQEQKTIKDAEERADLIFRTAKINCERTMMQFKTEVKQEQELLTRLRKATAEFKAKNLRLYKAHLAFIAQFCPDSPESDLLAKTDEQIAAETMEQVKLDIKDSGKSIFTEETADEMRDSERKREQQAEMAHAPDPDEQIDMLFESSIK